MRAATSAFRLRAGGALAGASGPSSSHLFPVSAAAAAAAGSSSSSSPAAACLQRRSFQGLTAVAPSTKTTEVEETWKFFAKGGLLHFRPRTNAMRNTVLVDKRHLFAGRPVEQLTERIYETGGRCRVTGRTTAWHRGARAHKRLYRLVDFKRDRVDEPAVVRRLEYDPTRSAWIALVEYESTGDLSYVLAPHQVAAGDVLFSTRDSTELTLPLSPGNAMPLGVIPAGTKIHNIESHPGRGGAYARSAGMFCQVKSHQREGTLVAMGSTEVRLLPKGCMATIGVVSNPLHSQENLGKAGRRRWAGWRPHVRGVCMNPVDHPHGGGEGKSGPGRHPVTPWGMLAKGPKTRNSRKNQSAIVVRRKTAKQKSRGISA